MKTLRPIDVGGLDLALLHRLCLMLPTVAEPTANGISIRGRGTDGHKLRRRLLVKADDMSTFPTIWADVEEIESNSAREPINAAAGFATAQRELRTGEFGNFGMTTVGVGPAERLALLQECLLPAFFSEYPRGEVHLVEYENGFNSSMAILNVLQRARHLQTSDVNTLQQYAGRDALQAFGLNVPAEVLWSALSLGLTWTYPNVYGLVASCDHQRFLVFIFDKPFDIRTKESTRFERMAPKMLSVLRYHPAKSSFARPSYIPPSFGRPLDRRTFHVSQMSEFLDSYVDALGETFAWIADLDNYGKVKEPDILDVDFASATWLTFFMLLHAQRQILNSTSHFLRKSALFDAFELFAALVTTNDKKQSEAWIRFASDDYSRKTLTTQLSAYKGAGNDLVASVLQIRYEAAAVVRSGLIYPPDELGRVLVSGSEPVVFDDFEPKFYRAMRNTQHGFVTKNSGILGVHTGDISNDLPDLAVAMFLGLLMDKKPFTLSRS